MVVGATKHTAGQIKSHRNKASHIEKQHTMFASYIAPAEPSIEGEQRAKSTFSATTPPPIGSGWQSQIGLEGD